MNLHTDLVSAAMASEPDIHHDPRIRSIPWRDLMPLRVREIAAELMLPVFWLSLSLFAARARWYAPALLL